MFQGIFIYALLASAVYTLDLASDAVVYDAEEAVTEEQQNFTFLGYLPETPSVRRNNIASRTKLVISRLPQSWDNALYGCFEVDGVLVSITNSEVDKAVRYAFFSQKRVGKIWTSGRYQNFWLSGYRYVRSFVWVGDGGEFLYTNWNNEPLNPNSTHCVAVEQKGYLESQYRWETNVCSERLNFICAL